MADSDPRVSVIIANHNGASVLPECLAALAAQTFAEFETIVVDNGSSDHSLRILERDFPAVRVIRRPENEGFARANNRGIRESSAPHAALINNDAIADPRWLERLVDAAERNPDAGMIASKILLGREGERIDSAGMLLYPDGMTRQRGRGEPDDGRFDSEEEVLFPSACAALLRRTMLDEIGGFDEDFGCYCEDSDLGLRARLAGWGAVLAPDAKVRHLYSRTGGEYSAFKAFQIERNHHFVLWKNLPLRYVALAPAWRAARYAVQVGGLLARRGSVARLAETLPPHRLVSVLVRADLSAMAGFLRNFMIKRRKVWQRRRIAVRDYLALLRRHRITARELMLRE